MSELIFNTKVTAPKKSTLKTNPFNAKTNFNLAFGDVSKNVTTQGIVDYNVSNVDGINNTNNNQESGANNSTTNSNSKFDETNKTYNGVYIGDGFEKIEDHGRDVYYNEVTEEYFDPSGGYYYKYVNTYFQDGNDHGANAPGEGYDFNPNPHWEMRPNITREIEDNGTITAVANYAFGETTHAERNMKIIGYSILTSIFGVYENIKDCAVLTFAETTWGINNVKKQIAELIGDQEGIDEAIEYETWIKEEVYPYSGESQKYKYAMEYANTLDNMGYPKEEKESLINVTQSITTTIFKLCTNFIKSRALKGGVRAIYTKSLSAERAYKNGATYEEAMVTSTYESVAVFAQTVTAGLSDIFTTAFSLGKDITISINNYNNYGKKTYDNWWSYFCEKDLVQTSTDFFGGVISIAAGDFIDKDMVKGFLQIFGETTQTVMNENDKE